MWRILLLQYQHRESEIWTATLTLFCGKIILLRGTTQHCIFIVTVQCFKSRCYSGRIVEIPD